MTGLKPLKIKLNPPVKEGDKVMCVRRTSSNSNLQEQCYDQIGIVSLVGNMIVGIKFEQFDRDLILLIVGLEEDLYIKL